MFIMNRERSCGIVMRKHNLLTGLLPEHDRSGDHEQHHQSQGSKEQIIRTGGRYRCGGRDDGNDIARRRGGSKLKPGRLIPRSDTGESEGRWAGLRIRPFKSRLVNRTRSSDVFPTGERDFHVAGIHEICIDECVGRQFSRIAADPAQSLWIIDQFQLSRANSSLRGHQDRY